MLRRFTTLATFGLTCLISSSALAQTPPPPLQGPPVETLDQAAPATVPGGTPILVEITDLVSTRTANRDDMFNLKLAEPITLNKVVAIPEGTPGKGQVVEAGKPGMGGKPGKLILAARYLEFEGRQIPIRGLKLALSASDNSGASVAASMAVGVFGLAVTGGHMEVKPGTRAHAKLAADYVPTNPVDPAMAPQPGPAEPASPPSN